MQNTIASAVEEQTATTIEISHDFEVATGSSQIAENITSVAQTAAETAQGAAQTQAAAREVREVGAGLRALVEGPDKQSTTLPVRCSADGASAASSATVFATQTGYASFERDLVGTANGSSNGRRRSLEAAIAGWRSVGPCPSHGRFSSP